MGQQDKIKSVQAAVSKRFGVTLRDLVSQKRSRDVVIPRLIAVYLSRTMSDATEETIGEAFGGRDHTIIRMYCRAISRRLAEDTAFAAMLREIEGSIARLPH